jgi:hypothetical protein
MPESVGNIAIYPMGYRRSAYLRAYPFLLSVELDNGHP